ncbi:Phosphoprotein phosphatase [Bertholletia excelsa]
MGNGVGKLKFCFAGGEFSPRRHEIAVFLSDPLDEGLGHSFCYFRSDQSLLCSDDAAAITAATGMAFKSISGASLSANTSTPLSTAPVDICPYDIVSIDKASSFSSSDSFASIPLQPIPRDFIPAVRSGPIPRSSASGAYSGPVERGFLSGPIERSFLSGPLENHYDQLQRYRPRSRKRNLIKNLKRAISNSIVVPILGPSEKFTDRNGGLETRNENGTQITEQGSLADEIEESFESTNFQWAQGKAGEDRVHIVVSEEQGWVFVGIYDGFNGPDATDFLVSNLYSNVQKELNGLLWNEKSESKTNFTSNLEKEMTGQSNEIGQSVTEQQMLDNFHEWAKRENYDYDAGRKRRRRTKNVTYRVGNKWEENQWRWRCEWDRERIELDRMLKEKMRNSGCDGVKHSDVLKALSVALRKTEESFLEIADLMLRENPELSLMGSCVLAMLMMGEDVYIMNVGDSRAVLARKAEPDLGIGKACQNLERIKEETLNDLEAFDGDEYDNLHHLTSVQLTMDHSTSVQEEVRRIKKEHQDDASAVTNDRVKGSLKVTRAFGAGFLKQPKWNDALIEMFRVDYIGNSPYINCLPSLCHHRLSPRDRFLILSSDGLYQYFTNEEAVSKVEMFMSSFPEGDPAQHLVEEVLFRAAKKAGMDFHELLEIPQGDRRRYHDDVSIIIISFEGRIWRSAM